MEEGFNWAVTAILPASEKGSIQGESRFRQELLDRSLREAWSRGCKAGWEIRSSEPSQPNVACWLEVDASAVAFDRRHLLWPGVEIAQNLKMGTSESCCTLR